MGTLANFLSPYINAYVPDTGYPGVDKDKKEYNDAWAWDWISQGVHPEDVRYVLIGYAQHGLSLQYYKRKLRAYGCRVVWEGNCPLARFWEKAATDYIAWVRGDLSAEDFWGRWRAKYEDICEKMEAEERRQRAADKQDGYLRDRARWVVTMAEDHIRREGRTCTPALVEYVKGEMERILSWNVEELNMREVYRQMNEIRL